MTALWTVRILTGACFFIPLILSVLLTPLAIRIAPLIGAIDEPKDDRRMHTKAIPVFGGFAIFLSGTITLLLILLVLFKTLPSEFQLDEPVGNLVGIIIGGAIIFLVGVYDDIKDMHPLAKLFCQIVSASIAFLFGIRMPAIEMLGLNFEDSSLGGMLFSYMATVIWIVAITNMINLIDGMDGLAAGVATISSIAIAYAAYIHGQYVVALAMVAVGGAASGFIPFNFFPAKIFMGDAGALYLGFTIGTISVIGPAKGATIVAIIVPVLVLGLPLFDVLFAIFRRLRSGRSILSADKGHLHHQLAYMGMGQRRSVLMIYGISAVMGIAAIVFSREFYLESFALFCVALLFVVILIWDWGTHEKK
ncbi:MAG: undecaprenyl/decaprenyl-phosphate alpha-N-acetylglucosaminyl 1-phosphate transferase [Clostridiales Family XIII bacterium]|jgi:UDP-GlcNAc:undecaprenyl-phosphate GlcNAc-1-phosphate transferase|nr:undecaprenyl/decaprenyl-phosphate alpha-N-acetylglucosaminyl 1-phosphate transferase [Clostridiales Family XIII bacterium]